MATSIYGMTYEELDAKRKHAPDEFAEFAAAFEMLDREGIADIIEDGGVYRLESYTLPHEADTDEARAELHRYIKRRGLRNLYD